MSPVFLFYRVVGIETLTISMEYKFGLMSVTCISILQSSRYRDFDDFHVDMMLVKENCCLYNPEQSAVRKDCDEVFAYYQQEYDKLMDKWQKVGLFITLCILETPKQVLLQTVMRGSGFEPHRCHCVVVLEQKH